MKKFYCFYCQKDVKPFKLLQWRFCPYCRHYMSDTGDGFYKVCDECGANMPVDSVRCLKCGNTFKGDNALKEYGFSGTNKTWFDIFISGLILILSILIGLGVLYLSFYAVLFFLVVGFVWFVLNSFRMRL